MERLEACYGQDSDEFTMLTVHYRCHPTIMLWFSYAYYAGKLSLSPLVAQSLDQTHPPIRGIPWRRIPANPPRSAPSRPTSLSTTDSTLVTQLAPSGTPDTPMDYSYFAPGDNQYYPPP